jgi:hypothetical protein
MAKTDLLVDSEVIKALETSKALNSWVEIK